MTGVPGVPLPEDWDLIPGARGCTPQACAFRDHSRELASFAAQIFGLSTQKTDYQREMAERLHLPFEVLSDANFAFANALKLPTFEAGGMRLIKRLTLITKKDRIEACALSGFPPKRERRSGPRLAETASALMNAIHHRSGLSQIGEARKALQQPGREILDRSG